MNYSIKFYNYSIKFAKKGIISYWLDKSNNKYVVSDMNVVEGGSTFRKEFDRFDDADKCFLDLCAEQGIEPQNVKRDPNNFKCD